MDYSNSPRPVVFGEALFDVFPGGATALGGAPFNVAWNLAGFGLNPLFITRIGEDERGRATLEAMKANGMDTAGVQIDPDKPTGVVNVKMTGGGHTFDILPDQAYDHIDAGKALAALGDGAFSLLYHGTLAARSDASRAALAALRERSDLPVFVDVNLRAPWTGGVSARAAIEGSRWVKLNNDELEQITGVPARNGAQPLTRAGLEAAAERLRSEAGLALVVVTRGEDGAMIVTPERVINADPAPVDDITDTVGAGDAFSAVAIAGLIFKWPEALILQRAVDFASKVCRIRGATTLDRDLCRRTAEEWSRGA